jgi:predicted esterase
MSLAKFVHFRFKLAQMIRLLPFLSLFLVMSANAQERIDGDFPFQTDPEKKYSLFIPEGYDAQTPHRLMLALHPWNTANWDAESWCDTLITFGTMNDLIIVCPDGGPDGQVDDPIDTAFTTALLDSVHNWYNIDTEKRYAMGFSWGGKTVYTYCLNHIDNFNGFIPIGAAINGTSEIDDVLGNSADLPWYLVHGSLDSPNTRFYPLLEGLEYNGAITNSNLMSGVDHTINFPDRNEILTTAFQWVDSVNCGLITDVPEPIVSNNVLLTPSPAYAGQEMHLLIEHHSGGMVEISIFSVKGQLVEHRKAQITSGANTLPIELDGVEPGNYIALVKGAGLNETISFIILN